MSVKTYEQFLNNPNSLYSWYPALELALLASDSKLKTPDTKVLRLPIELAQFIRLEYQETSQADKDLFNHFIFDQFGLEDGKTYFIKTGTFSKQVPVRKREVQRAARDGRILSGREQFRNESLRGALCGLGRAGIHRGIRQSITGSFICYHSNMSCSLWTFLSELWDIVIL